MPSHDKHEPADWEKWGDMLSAELWVAVALSLDIEPGSLLIDWRDADYSDPFEDCPCEFKRRMAIALNYAKNGALPLTSLAFTDPPFSTIRLKDFADWAESSLGWSLPDRFPRNKKDAPWAGDDPKLWPPEAREKLARVEAEERDLRDRLRQQYEAALKELDRVPLSQALRMAAEAGKTDPWRWVMAKIREGDLRAWGTVGNTHDRPLEPPWLDHVKVFTDDDGHPRPPTDDCLWFEPGGGRPRRFSDISLDAGALTELLDRPSVFGAEGERALAPRSDTVVDSNHEDALAPNKRGPAGRKKAGAIARMVRAVEKGEKTIVQLQRMKQKELDNFYPDAGRTTLAEAHKEALKILRQNSGKTPTNDK